MAMWIESVSRQMALWAAGLLSLAFLVWPGLAVDAGGKVQHGMLSLTLLGVSLCFLQGFGLAGDIPGLRKIQRWPLGLAMVCLGMTAMLINS